MEFLAQQNQVVGGETVRAKDLITAAGKKVVVIGGGDTGADCIGTSWRQGATEVTQLEILPEPPASRSQTTPWPEWPLMRRDSSSHKEGGTRRWSVDTLSFSGEKGHVQKLECVDVEWTVDENRGRLRPERIEGSNFVIEADLVLLAMGFVGPTPTPLFEELGLELNQRGFITRRAC